MSQPDETHACAYCGDEHPRRVACTVREPEPDLTCPGCEGDGLCHCDECPGAHATCEWCDGTGTYVRPEPSPAELKARHMALEAALLMVDSFGRLSGGRP